MKLAQNLLHQAFYADDKLEAPRHRSFIQHAWWQCNTTPEISSPEHCGNNETHKIADKFYALILPVDESSDNTDCFNEVREAGWKDEAQKSRKNKFTWH
jgi:hypothetical protein